MIPIRDLNPTRTFPYIIVVLIVLNVYIFALQSLMLKNIDDQLFYFNHGVLPKCFMTMFNKEKYEEAIEETKDNLAEVITKNTAVQKRWRMTRVEQQLVYREARALVDKHFNRTVFGHGGVLAEIASLFTSLFMHGGLLHLVGNMWFLWIFGNNIEEHMGALKFTGFYFACGILASLGHILTSASSVVPTIGASGAISGVLGAYVLLYPHARILSFIPIGYFLWLEEVPAWVFLGFWILIQILSQMFRDPVLRGGVAFLAHIAGFFAGIALVLLFGRKPRHVMDLEEEDERETL